jgi:hypothetical protein
MYALAMLSVEWLRCEYAKWLPELELLRAELASSAGLESGVNW